MARISVALELYGSDRWRLAIREHSGTGIELSHVVWEAISGDSPPTHRLIRQTELTDLFNGTGVPASGELVSRPVDFAEMPPGVLSVRLVGTDVHGYRVAAWATVALRPKLLAAR